MTLHEALDVSVVIPCLNESQSIAFCIDKAIAAFKEAGIHGEVVVSDNGSIDGSIEIAEKHGARVVHALLRGYGHTLRKGIEEARGQFIVMGDGDDSYDFSQVPRFSAKWREGYEVVMGNRFKGEIKPGAMRWHHKYIGNPVLSGILKLFFRTDIGDAHCGMRGFTKSVYERMDLRTTGMEFASEFVVKAATMGVLARIPGCELCEFRQDLCNHCGFTSGGSPTEQIISHYHSRNGIGYWSGVRPSRVAGLGIRAGSVGRTGFRTSGPGQNTAVGHPGDHFTHPGMSNCFV